MAFWAWIRSARLAAQSNIAPPLLLGQCAALGLRGGDLDTTTFVLAMAFGLFDQLYIVWANDVADRDVDRINTTATIFSGGSRVLVEGRLSPTAVGTAAVIAAGSAAAVSVALALLREQWTPVILAALAILLLIAYSYPPLRLSYRGGGELLQMIGVGVILPLYGFTAQGGALGAFPWSLLAFLLPAQLACAIATSLPDEPSDRAGHKRTLAVLTGGGPAALVVAALQLAAIAAYATLRTALFSQPAPIAWLAVPLASVAGHLALAGARPGSRTIGLRVFLMLLASLSLVALPAVDFLRIDRGG